MGSALFKKSFLSRKRTSKKKGTSAQVPMEIVRYTFGLLWGMLLMTLGEGVNGRGHHISKCSPALSPPKMT